MVICNGVVGRNVDDDGKKDPSIVAKNHVLMEEIQASNSRKNITYEKS